MAQFNQQATGSTAAQMQSEFTNREDAAANNQDATVQTNTPLNPAEQSQLDREANYVEQANKVATKMATKPENVTKEDGDTMHSRETKAYGNTEKGGIASQAQNLVASSVQQSYSSELFYLLACLYCNLLILHLIVVL
ncbi:hypothetical protein OEA41_004149 [Lepraria neglecta]|uniref:Uncharacterized protein n=1 Tax=Lepraria neglecta TaxID=209136 RepID=A0AAD9Z5Z2_9LECA|nr:hypothetical protein OEA41_004149 [Lepraria neglecta]